MILTAHFVTVLVSNHYDLANSPTIIPYMRNKVAHAIELIKKEESKMGYTMKKGNLTLNGLYACSNYLFHELAKDPDWHEGRPEASP